MKLAIFFLACTVIAARGVASSAEEITVANSPPVVVKTVPESGALDVDPGLSEIRATFSKGMKDGSWSWSQRSADTFPGNVGKPRYEKDGRTCVLPVKLEPGRTYLILLNSEKFKNVKDADGRAAMPYLLVFRTKPAP
jgi:Bacterial Ig-like domain